MPHPSAVAVLTVAGLVLVSIAVGLVGGATGGVLVGIACGVFQAGLSCLVLAWLVERPAD